MDDRAKREKDFYNTGFDEARLRYNKKFGHANSGYFIDVRNEHRMEIMRKAKGKKVLEVGSYFFDTYLDLKNHAPASVTCINISETELEKDKEKFIEFTRDEKLSTEFEFLIMDAHNLKFPDESFDIVYGDAILHHLDFEKAVSEVSRVLKKGGFCLFSEPMGCNPVGFIVRKLTPSARTPDEKPLGKHEINILNKYFKTTYRFFGLFYVPMGAFTMKFSKNPYNIFMYIANKLDVFMEKCMPMRFRMLYRLVHVYGQKEGL